MLVDAPVRGADTHGSGSFGAPRGSRKHDGVDIACYRRTVVLSVSDGRVTKTGHPSDPKKGHLRYVQVSYGDLDFRYFYVSPSVSVGDAVVKGDALGATAGLLDIYPGITDHYHFEIKENGKHVNPEDYL